MWAEESKAPASSKAVISLGALLGKRSGYGGLSNWEAALGAIPGLGSKMLMCNFLVSRARGRQMSELCGRPHSLFGSLLASWVVTITDAFTKGWAIRLHYQQHLINHLKCLS